MAASSRFLLRIGALEETMRKSLAMAVGVVALALASSPANAQTPYYQGKQIRILVGFTPGGGSDLYGRMIAEGLARTVEGKPSIVVQNMPGASSVVSMNYFVQKAPHDGTTIIIASGQSLMRLVLGLDGAKAKISELEALVATPMGRITYGSPVTGIKVLKDLLNPREPLMAGVPEVISSIDMVLGLTLVKANFRAIMGYPGKAETRLALLRNEVNIDSQATPLFEASVRPVIKEGKAFPLFAQGFMDGDKLVRDPAAPDIPTAGEAYREIHGTEPSGPAWEAYVASVRAAGNGGKILLTHKDVEPAARVALKRAIDLMIKDPEYLKKAESVLEGYGFNTGDNLVSTIAAIDRMKQEDIAWLQNLLSRDFRLKFN
jgi:tripartite-type tricarboxylate transporter receptor subunit TctC